MNFEEYVVETVTLIAEGKRFDRETFDARMDLFFTLIGRGMNPPAARAVMDLYVAK